MSYSSHPSLFAKCPCTEMQFISAVTSVILCSYFWDNFNSNFFSLFLQNHIWTTSLPLFRDNLSTFPSLSEEVENEIYFILAPSIYCEYKCKFVILKISWLGPISHLDLYLCVKLIFLSIFNEFHTVIFILKTNACVSYLFIKTWIMEVLWKNVESIFQIILVVFIKY